VSRLSAGLDIPAPLFGILQEHLLIRQGALLLFEPEEQKFVAWSAAGFDGMAPAELSAEATSPGEMALPELDTPAIVGREEAGGFCPFLRDVPGPDYSLLLPFVHDDELIAVLLIADSPGLEPSQHEYFLEACRRIADETAERLYARREGVLRRLPVAGPSSSAHAAERLVETFEECQRRGRLFVVATVSLDGYLQDFAERFPQADPRRPARDVGRVLTSIVGTTGAVCATSGGALVMALCANMQNDADMLVHRISDDLDQLFRFDSADISFAVHEVPADSPRGFLRELA
jgi:hypothetical protein